MIGKFTKDEIESAWVEPVAGNIQSIYGKINEIVDAVNEIMTWRFETDDEPAENGEISKMEKDPYAEQREWIGKLCRFWDDNYKTIKHFGILTRIDEMAIVPYEAENGFWYCACEPVKPDDDIIFKGE